MDALDDPRWVVDPRDTMTADELALDLAQYEAPPEAYAELLARYAEEGREAEGLAAVLALRGFRVGPVS